MRKLCCQQALAIDAGHADSLHLMGLLSLDAGQYDHAVQWIARAVKQRCQGRNISSAWERRCDSWDGATRRCWPFNTRSGSNPRHWDAAHECGALLYQSGRLQDALGYLTAMPRTAAGPRSQRW